MGRCYKTSEFYSSGSNPYYFYVDRYYEEIDYYVFSYSVLKSLTIHDPQCIFFEDGSLPPVDTKVTIIAPAGSKAQEIAEKYGNPFIAE